MIQLLDISLSRSSSFQAFSWSPGNDHWVIAGPAGGGKTTLLELLAGRILAQKGEIHYSFIPETNDGDRFDARRERILYIPAGDAQLFNHHDQYYQQRYYSLGDEMTPTVSEWLGMQVSDFKSQISRDRLPASINAISNLLDVEINRLSNGQLKKVHIWKHLLNKKPKLLLWDYPFEGLDSASRSDLCEFLDELVQHTSMQLIIADHHNELPKCISKRIFLSNFKIDHIEDVTHLSTNNSRTPPSLVAELHGEVIVEMKDVRIRYGNKIILDHINWTIRKGERWALTGPNGSGKTTLFSLIFADHPLAYSNQVWLFGRRRGTGESIWQIKARIAYLGPEVVRFLNPSELLLTANEFLANNSSNEVQLLEMIDFFRTQHWMDRPLKKLSSGELQVIMLMNCFLQDRELYLLDEPFQFLDHHYTELTGRYMQSHLGPDKTLVLISHHEEELKWWTRERMELGKSEELRTKSEE